MDIRKQVAKYGKENVVAMIPSLPLNKIMFINYTSSSDQTVTVPCRVVERQYAVEDGYKIEFYPMKPFDGLYETHAFYQSDFNTLAEQEYVHVYVDAQLLG